MASLHNGYLEDQKKKKEQVIDSPPDFLKGLVGSPLPETMSPSQAAFEKTGSPLPNDPDNMLPEQRALPDFMRNIVGPEITDQPSQTEADHAPYDWTAAGAPLPGFMQPVGDTVALLNDHLATAVGMPAEALDEVMKYAGMNGVLDKPGNAIKGVKKAMTALGIANNPDQITNKWTAELGAAGVENVLQVLAFMAAGPTILARQGGGAATQVIKQLAQLTMENPGLAIKSAVGSTIGGQALGTLGGTLGPTGQALGEVAGSLVGGMAPTAMATAGIGAAVGGIPGAVAGAAAPFGVGRVVSAARQGFKNVSGAISGAKTAMSEAMERPPLLPTTNPQTQLIQQAISSDKSKVENIITKLTDRFTKGQDPMQATQRLQDAQRAAYRPAREIETGYWNKVNMKRRMPTFGVKEGAKAIRNSVDIEGRSEFLPNDLLAKIKGLPQNAPISRLRTIRSIALQRLRSGVVPSPTGELRLNDTMRAKLNEVADLMDTQIEKAFPNDIEMKKATAFSRWLHDRFTRGPISQFARPRADESTLPPIDRAGKTALGHEEFGPLSASIQPGLAKGAAETGVDVELPAATKAAENFMRGQLAGEAELRGPAGMQKLLATPRMKAFVKAFPKVAGEFSLNTDRLNKALTSKKEIFDSAFVKAMNEEPESAVSRALLGNNKLKDSKMLVERLKHDPDAMDAAKSQAILELERASGSNPQRLLTLLDSPDTRTAVKTILGDDDAARLERIATKISSLIHVSKGSIKTHIAARSGKVLGSVIARKVLKLKTIQSAQYGGEIVQNVFNKWIDNNFDSLLSVAIRSSAGEALLNAKSPTQVSELYELNKRLRNAIRVVNAGESAIGSTVDRYSKDEQ